MQYAYIFVFERMKSLVSSIFGTTEYWIIWNTIGPLPEIDLLLYELDKIGICDDLFFTFSDLNGINDE